MNNMRKSFDVAFGEWDRRYRENPEKFMADVEHLLGHTAESYGEACAVYFEALLNELSAGKPWASIGATPGVRVVRVVCRRCETTAGLQYPASLSEMTVNRDINLRRCDQIDDRKPCGGALMRLPYSDEWVVVVSTGFK